MKKSNFKKVVDGRRTIVRFPEPEVVDAAHSADID